MLIYTKIYPNFTSIATRKLPLEVHVFMGKKIIFAQAKIEKHTFPIK